METRQKTGATRAGLFLVFEGIEGSGKSTQVKHSAEFLRNKGLSVFITREPGGTALGNEVRKLITRSSDLDIAPLTELLLIEAARHQHVACVLQPKLAQYDVVISDRYHHSSLAYQGFGRGLSLDTITELNALATRNLKPNRVFLFDLDARQALARAHRRMASTAQPLREDRFENEALAFHEKVRQGYLQLAKMEPDIFFLVPAGQSERDITEILVAQLHLLLGSYAT